MHRLLIIFSTMHWLGLAMLTFGLYSLWKNTTLDTRSMTLYASMSGIGLLMMAPYPVVLCIRWSQKKRP